MAMMPKRIAVLLLAAIAACAADSSMGDMRAEIEQLRNELRAEKEKMHVEREHLHEEIHAVETLVESRRLTSASAVEALAASTESAMSSAWLILCGALVMFMHAGFAMLETGSCRAKNASNVLMKNLVNVTVGTIGWYFFGYAFAYGIDDHTPQKATGGNGFIGYDGFAGKGFLTHDTTTGTITYSGHVLSWFFQWAFCTAGATIVSGAVAERVLSPTYACYAFVMTSFIYPVVVSWTWGYGWVSNLFDAEVIDFAGSGIVHLTGGVAGLAGTIVLGPRKGRFENPDDFAPHNLPLLCLGTFILWFGWYGFNCGSTLGMSEGSGNLAAQVAMNTTIAASTGGVTVFFLRFGLTKLYDTGGLCNGILAGLVSITGPCGNVEAGSALVIGLIGGFVYQGASMLLVKLKIDDPVDAVPVHGACGIWGVLAAVLFDWGTGFKHFHGWSGFGCKTVEDGSACDEGVFGKVLGAHIVFILAVIGWSGILSGLTFFGLMKTGFLRIDETTEETGVDAAKHSPGKAYSMPAPANDPAAI